MKKRRCDALVMYVYQFLVVYDVYLRRGCGRSSFKTSSAERLLLLSPQRPGTTLSGGPLCMLGLFRVASGNTLQLRFLTSPRRTVHIHRLSNALRASCSRRANYSQEQGHASLATILPSLRQRLSAFNRAVDNLIQHCHSLAQHA